jgi:hypothetical protein
MPMCHTLKFYVDTKEIKKQFSHNFKHFQILFSLQEYSKGKGH